MTGREEAPRRHGGHGGRRELLVLSAWCLVKEEGLLILESLRASSVFSVVHLPPSLCHPMRGVSANLSFRSHQIDDPNNRSTNHGLPTICKLTGIPSSARPQGTDTVGSPL